jgi:hypothetical protein
LLAAAAGLDVTRAAEPARSRHSHGLGVVVDDAQHGSDLSWMRIEIGEPVATRTHDA